MSWRDELDKELDYKMECEKMKQENKRLRGLLEVARAWVFAYSLFDEQNSDKAYSVVEDIDKELSDDV